MIYKIATFLFENKNERNGNKLYELYNKKHKISREEWNAILQELAKNKIIVTTPECETVRVIEDNYYIYLQTKPKWYEKNLYKSIVAICGLITVLISVLSFLTK